jgi:hypothetical protein
VRRALPNNFSKKKKSSSKTVNNDIVLKKKEEGNIGEVSWFCHPCSVVLPSGEEGRQE